MITQVGSVCRRCAQQASRHGFKDEIYITRATSQRSFYHISTTSSARGIFSQVEQKISRSPIAYSKNTGNKIASFQQVRRASQFQPLKPPSPDSLGKPKLAKSYRRSRKWLRRLIYTSLGVAVVLTVDQYAYDACLSRSLRTFRTAIITAADYQLNYRVDPWFGENIGDVHRRGATRVFELLRENGGLYLKIGQAIAMQSAILPPEFQKMFARMFDDAPQNSWKDVERVVREDFGGRSIEEVFGVSFTGEPGKGVMEKTARASASVAQVHWARLPDGREVAIKVQKRQIARQVGWDLWAFKLVTRVYSWYFDLPMDSLVPYISERLMLETDFENEARNAAKMRELVQGEPRLRDRVYIPQAYKELSSKRIMTAEWIEGVRLWDKEGITGKWEGGWFKGSPGANGAQLPPLTPREMQKAAQQTSQDAGKLKPNRDTWKGSDGKGGLGLRLKPVMQTMVDLFSAQMFLWGIVHCDPHPGNIFVRRQPNGKPELVLIDHGLYITMPDTFRKQYALFWRSLMTFDNKTIARLTQEWGINAPDIFASATLMRPYEGGDGKVMKELKDLSKREQRERQFEMQQKMRKATRDILGNQEKFPQELIFLGRNMRIVQGNNQYLGSPVNRLKIMGSWASRALADDRSASFSERVSEYGKHALFRVAILSTDLFFYWSKVKQLLGKGKGMDDDLEESMKKMAEGMGVDLNHGVFDG